MQRPEITVGEWGEDESRVVSIRKVQKNCHKPWLVWLGGLNARLRSKGSPVRFLVRAHV